jgi:hypothetical protein
VRGECKEYQECGTQEGYDHHFVDGISFALTNGLIAEAQGGRDKDDDENNCDAN